MEGLPGSVKETFPPLDRSEDVMLFRPCGTAWDNWARRVSGATIQQCFEEHVMCVVEPRSSTSHGIRELSFY